METLLVVDDEPNVLYSLGKALRADGLRVLTAATAAEGVEAVRGYKPDAVILDVRLPDFTGLEAFDRMRAIDPRLPVIMLTAYSTTATAIEAMKRGAFEYLLKPVDFHQLRAALAKALELRRMRAVPAVFDPPAEADGPVDQIVGRSPAMQEVYKAVGRVTGQNLTVLITGQSGTGKELIARAIYQHSDRADGPFLAINCAAIPETLLESELFGHEKGAFTGADRQRVGKFEQCNGGTVFLDEVGDMAPLTQAKILRVLQEQRFERVGGNETVRTDVRVIAATNRDLERLVAAGRFRQDLYYRLKVFSIHLPPLRDRREDLPLLVDYFVRQTGRELGRSVRAVAPEALAVLERYDWPGNVRELQSCIKYAVVHAGGDVLTPDCLPPDVRPAVGTAPPDAPGALEVLRVVREMLRAGERDVYRKVTQAVDRILLTEVLRHAEGSQVVASEILGISRTTIRNKLRSLGLAVEKQLLDESDQPE